MTSTFQSHDTSVSELLQKIANGKTQLPDFQRGWVWDDKHITALIASISNQYPVGALMFLEYNGESIRFKYRPLTGASGSNTPETLVLDGQQRLTSIFSSMYSKDPVETKTDKGNLTKRFYYLDIDKCLSGTTDRQEAVVSIPENKMLLSNFGRDIMLDISTREKEFECHLFPLNIVYNFIECTQWQNAYQKYHGYDPKILDRYAEFNAEILIPIQSYKVPVITLGNETPKEAVCQVFENVNTGGVSLTIFELMTATFAAENFELRKDWDTRREVLITKSALSATTKNSSVLSVVSSTDFLIAMTLLSRYYNKDKSGEAVSCKKKDVLNLTLDDYTKYSDQLTNGFLRAASFLKEQRIFSSRDLPYSSQLIPMSVVFTILGDRSKDGTIKDKISRWYWCGVMGEMYGGANETRYANDVTGIIEWIRNGAEPDTIQRAYFQPTRLLSLQTRLSAAYKGVMALTLKTGCLDFISGSPMDFTVFLEENVDIHHIFPQEYCESNSIPKKKWNSIVNKTPLSARTNRIIGGSAPSKYLKQIETADHVTEEKLDEFVSTHLVDVDCLRADNFDEYFLHRAKSLINIISRSMGKPVTNLAGDDVITGFGGSLE
jgi:hypothetical protein